MSSAPGPFLHQLRVRFADEDHAGIVYYPRFFHFFHVAFEEMFFARLGGAANYRELLDQRKVGFPAVRAEIDFAGPLRFGDLVEIELSVDRIGTKSVSFAYRASRCEGDERHPAAAGKVTCAAVDLATFRSIPIPDDLRALFEALRRDVA
ncbi:MAG: acyl-CoA thioesterase [Myxococcales bacterium]|nr:acyl-CoA thioesterase [Myxococcales bacterium]